MAVVNDSGDKMRDIIADVAAGLEGGGDGADEVVDNAGAEGATDAEAEPLAAEGEDAPADAPTTGDEPVVAEADPAAAARPAPAGKGDEQADGAVPAAKVATADDKAKKPEDTFAKEHGLKAADAMGRPNRIPYPVVRDRIVPNAIKKAKGEWETTVLKPVQAQVEQQNKDLASFRGVEKILLEEPRRYVAILMQSVPGYKQLFEEMGAGKLLNEGKDGKEGAKPAVGTNLADDPNDPEPQPDVKDKDGNPIGYSPAGHAAVRAWDRRQAKREAVVEANKSMEQRFGKVLTREEKLQQDEAALQTVDSAIEGASKWPGFMENHEAILTELAKGKDPLSTGEQMQKALHDAYTTVMFGAVTKHKETEEESRKRHFDEFQKSLRRAPRSTSSTSQVARREPATEVDENMSSEDRMRNIIADVTSRLK